MWIGSRSAHFHDADEGSGVVSLLCKERRGMNDRRSTVMRVVPIFCRRLPSSNPVYDAKTVQLGAGQRKPAVSIRLHAVRATIEDSGSRGQLAYAELFIGIQRVRSSAICGLRVFDLGYGPKQGSDRVQPQSETARRVMLINSPV
jgi:hypothetical protein